MIWRCTTTSSALVGSSAMITFGRRLIAMAVTTRCFTVSRECGLPEDVKQRYFEASEEQIEVNQISPTGYPMRMLSNSPAIGDALGIEGDEAFEDLFVGRIVVPAVGVEHGGVEFVVQLLEHGDEAFFVDELFLGRQRRIAGADRLRRAVVHGSVLPALH